MKIAICSDIHDNIWKLEKALLLMSSAKELIFCGDFCAPFTLAQMAEGFQGTVHVIFGNNDGDPRLLTMTATKAGNVRLYGQFAELKIGGIHIAVNHYPEIARSIANGAQFGMVCYGHDHKLYQEYVGDCLLLNPGEIMGRFGRSTFMLVETDDCSVTVVDVG